LAVLLSVAQDECRAVDRNKQLTGSAHLTAHFAAAGVLDELRIMVCPIAIGQGRSHFEDLKGRLALKLAQVRQFDSGNVVGIPMLRHALGGPGTER